MYFWVDDVDALYEEFVGRGAKIDYGLCDQPYGCREFGTQDIDGHDIGFGQIISWTGKNSTDRAFALNAWYWASTTRKATSPASQFSLSSVMCRGSGLAHLSRRA